MTNGPSNDALKDRGIAWELGLRGEYEAALAVLDKLLSEGGPDLVALRMKANLLELKALDQLEYDSAKLTLSDDYLAARDCYLSILESEPQNVTALVDLGDHYKNLGAYGRAFSFYQKAIDAMKQQPDVESCEPVIKELLVTLEELSGSPKASARVADLQSACHEALRRVQSNQR